MGGPCFRCGRYGHWAGDCYAKSSSTGTYLGSQRQSSSTPTHATPYREPAPRRYTVENSSVTCSICGRTSHTSAQCYAVRDVRGSFISTRVPAQDSRQALPSRTQARPSSASPSAPSQKPRGAHKSWKSRSAPYKSVYTSRNHASCDSEPLCDSAANVPMPAKVAVQYPAARDKPKAPPKAAPAYEDDDTYCLLCGRPDHIAGECYAMWTVTGERILVKRPCDEYIDDYLGYDARWDLPLPGPNYTNWMLRPKQASSGKRAQSAHAPATKKAEKHRYRLGSDRISTKPSSASSGSQKQRGQPGASRSARAVSRTNLKSSARPATSRGSSRQASSGPRK